MQRKPEAEKFDAYSIASHVKAADIGTWYVASFLLTFTDGQGPLLEN
jgi:hypothetical protein